MNDLITKTPDVELHAQQTIQWLEQIESDAEKLFEEDFEAGLNALHAVETIEVAATKTRMDEVMRKAAYTKLRMGRVAGRVLDKLIPDNADKHRGGRPKTITDGNSFRLKDYDIKARQSSDWQKLSKMPDYLFQYALISTNIPTVSHLLREYDRYEKLRSVVEQAELADGEDILKRFVDEGFSVSQAIAELTLKNEDEEGEFDFLDEDEEDESEEEIEETAVYNFRSDMEDFAVNADAMQKVVEEIRMVFTRITAIRREDFKVGTIALTNIKKAVKELIALFKEAQEKVEIR